MPAFFTFLSLVSLLVTLTPSVAAIPAASFPSTLPEALSNASINANGPRHENFPKLIDLTILTI